ncbi:MAG TPA: trehalose-phosphatase [Clostridia bacterium]|nr:trehalose-phosphatase [Clostridia bacterium]
MSTAVTRTSQALPFFRSPVAPRRALLLDYDGTLAPFVADRHQAYPYPHITELLDEIMAHSKTRVIIVSGRQASEIPLLLKTARRPEVWGCHGLERMRTDGSSWRSPLDGAVERALDAVFADLSNRGFSELTETKPGCVALHWRGLSASHAEAAKATAYNCFSRYVAVGGLRIEEFDHGVELRVGCNKAKVVKTILSELGADAAVAYLGDDTTDEYAFRALHGRGLTVLVRPSYRFTAAQYWLRPPHEVEWFLRDWIQACTEVQP